MSEDLPEGLPSDKEYERRIIYAGEREETKPKEEEKPKKVESRIYDWILVMIAVVGLILTIYYIGFGRIDTSINIWKNATNASHGKLPNATKNQTQTNATAGALIGLDLMSDSNQIYSRQDVNVRVTVTCSAKCNALYLALFDGQNELVTYENESTWQGTKNVTLTFIAPKENNVTVALELYADTKNATNRVYGANPEMRKTYYFDVLFALQQVIYGKEFFLELGEKANLSDLNVSISLDSLQVNSAKVSVIKKDGTMFSSTLDLINKPNATFFDFLTLELLDIGKGQIKLVAYPNGQIESVSILVPDIGVQNITKNEKFQLYLICSGVCAGTFVGIHIDYANTIARVGLYNKTAAWTGYKYINVTLSVPVTYENATVSVKVLADSKNSKYVSYVDYAHPPERIISRSFTIR